MPAAPLPRRRPAVPGQDAAALRRQRILATVDAVPPGRVTTYGDVAREADLPGRARLVGRLLRELPSGSPLPWHRVLGAGGRLRTRDDAARTQARRLRAEGVELRAGRVDLARYGWDGA